MLWRNQKRRLEDNETISEERLRQERRGRTNTVAGITAAKTAQKATAEAAAKFAKPSQYTGHRGMFDDGGAKRNAKMELFADGKAVVDPYTGQRLVLTKREAKALYGENWTSHLAESDHIVPIERVYKTSQDDPWVTTDDMKAAINSSENISVTSRKFNNAKRSRTNKQLVEDQEYLTNKGIVLTQEGKDAALRDGRTAERAIQRQLGHAGIRSAAETFHAAGMSYMLTDKEQIAIYFDAEMRPISYTLFSKKSLR